ncbi:hypothetical protein CCHR01_09073 [Colletotrichum chrysophilum]|uniref:Uncharacterized protein n=1 Tax=Colletotrichum chrysophilum TaxID=1836956 RepID=A0AAD9AHN1_9PEZI|nr:hypothetical protein CCHR01_09073 [Colletotrichum chrysophilum]
MWLGLEIINVVLFPSPSFPIPYTHRRLAPLSRLNFTHPRWVEIWGRSLTGHELVYGKTSAYAIRMQVIHIGQGWQVVGGYGKQSCPRLLLLGSDRATSRMGL